LRELPSFAIQTIKNGYCHFLTTNISS